MPLVYISVPSSTPQIYRFDLVIVPRGLACCSHDFLFFSLLLSECNNSSTFLLIPDILSGLSCLL
jgi:hypothetical protein